MTKIPFISRDFAESIVMMNKCSTCQKILERTQGEQEYVAVTEEKNYPMGQDHIITKEMYFKEVHAGRMSVSEER